MTNRPEFKAHDDFIFEHKEIGKVTREEFIKYIRNSHKHMRKLSKIIQQYNQTIDDYLEEWDGRFESFDDDVKDLLGSWIQDGTMDHIINETLMSSKADKEYVDELHETTTAQLDQTIQQNRTYIDDQLNKLNGLELKGAYSTLQDLISAYPSGAEGIFLVQENGHWYYWNGSWSDGGLYQATPWDEFMTTENEEWAI